jgi:hypothetical protein
MSAEQFFLNPRPQYMHLPGGIPGEEALDLWLMSQNSSDTPKGPPSPETTSNNSEQKNKRRVRAGLVNGYYFLLDKLLPPPKQVQISDDALWGLYDSIGFARRKAQTQDYKGYETYYNYAREAFQALRIGRIFELQLKKGIISGIRLKPRYKELYSQQTEYDENKQLITTYQRN